MDACVLISSVQGLHSHHSDAAMDAQQKREAKLSHRRERERRHRVCGRISEPQCVAFTSLFIGERKQAHLVISMPALSI